MKLGKTCKTVWETKLLKFDYFPRNFSHLHCYKRSYEIVHIGFFLKKKVMFDHCAESMNYWQTISFRQFIPCKPLPRK